jgi:nitrogen regulatory protein PII-like uncharacterized protein
MVSSLSRKLYKEALALEKKGREEGRRAIVMNMLRDGCTTEFIAKYTDMSPDEINTLREATLKD